MCDVYFDTGGIDRRGGIWPYCGRESGSSDTVEQGLENDGNCHVRY